MGPLEGGNKEWQYALQTASVLRVERAPMASGRWDWPLDSPLKIFVQARTRHWPDVWSLPPDEDPASPLGNREEETNVELALVPYGCTKVFRVSMFPYSHQAAASKVEWPEVFSPVVSYV